MIRLKRIGKKHQPAYRLVIGEKRDKLNGRELEDLGWFNPMEDKSEFNKDRILYWIKMGAGLSDTVHNLLLTAKIIEGKKIAVHNQPEKAEGDKKPADAPAAKPAETSAPVEEKK